MSKLHILCDALCAPQDEELLNGMIFSLRSSLILILRRLTLSLWIASIVAKDGRRTWDAK